MSLHSQVAKPLLFLGILIFGLAPSESHGWVRSLLVPRQLSLGFSVGASMHSIAPFSTSWGPGFSIELEEHLIPGFLYLDTGAGYLSRFYDYGDRSISIDITLGIGLSPEKSKGLNWGAGLYFQIFGGKGPQNVEISGRTGAPNSDCGIYAKAKFHFFTESPIGFVLIPKYMIGVYNPLMNNVISQTLIITFGVRIGSL